MQIETITTFFSWQSDVTKQAKFIREALAEISPLIKNSTDNLKIVNDEATRERPGSPDISLTILEKISQSDIFIADVTIINERADTNLEGEDDQSRLTPNPNVMFELGFAVALLGWDRIILLNNNKISSIDNLPFDIRNQRITCFSAQTFNNSEKGNLKNSLREALDMITKFYPDRSIEKVVKSKDEIKRERDIRKLRMLLKEVDFDGLLGSIEYMPYRIEDRLAHYFEFSEMYFSTYCDLYDKKIESKFKELFSIYSLLAPSIGYYDFNNNINTNNRFYSINRNNLSQKFYDDASDNIIKLKNIITEIKTVIREDYIEIDLDVTNNQARNEYTQLFATDNI